MRNSRFGDLESWVCQIKAASHFRKLFFTIFEIIYSNIDIILNNFREDICNIIFCQFCKLIPLKILNACFRKIIDKSFISFIRSLLLLKGVRFQHFIIFFVDDNGLDKVFDRLFFPIPRKNLFHVRYKGMFISVNWKNFAWKPVKSFF